MGGGDVRVLIVEDEPCIRDTLTELFDVPENSTHAAATLSEAQQALAQASFDLIVTDLRLGDRHDGGLQVLGASGLLSPAAAAIVLTAFPSPDNRQACRRLGATHFLPKPTDLHTIASLAWQHGVCTTMGRPEAAATEVGELAPYDR
jgi:two-component system response regulator PilR (NtrC family)